MSLVGSWIRGQHWSQDRKAGYVPTRSGRRYCVTHQTIATAVTGQTSFDATTPTFLIYQTSAEGIRQLCLSGLELCQAGTVAGGIIHVVIALDTTNRFSAGGTAVTPQNALVDSSNAQYANAAGFSFKYNATASAAGSGTRYIKHYTVAPNSSAPVPFALDTEDSIQIGKTGSILVYTYAATTGPTWHFNFEVNEEDR